MIDDYNYIEPSLYDIIDDDYLMFFDMPIHAKDLLDLSYENLELATNLALPKIYFK
jgi:hypothetical protein